MNRVRFAPSPTGFLHIGGSRTAVFNWIFARATQGQFILRIEDTDAVRSKPEFVDEILGSLTWLGFHWDELYYQSQRTHLYRQYAETLLSQGKAYVEKTEGKGEAVIYKVTPQEIVLNDDIRGRIVFDSAVIKDQVLIKSDGTATYNFACVVDDALMNISHVIRGDDHISNTPKQIMLYQALGFPLPHFAHLPLIMGMDGGRLSKRTGATAISDYRQMGYLPEALVNYLLLLSWNPGGDKEFVDVEEAIRLFALKDVSKTPATFDIKKLDWMNNQYLKSRDPGKLADELMPLLEAKGLTGAGNFSREYLISLVQLFQNRMTTLHDFADRADFFFLDEPVFDPAAVQKYLSRDLSREFTLFVSRLDALPEWSVAAIEAAFRDMVAELGIEAKVLIHPVRVALSGKTVGPGLFELIYHLGRDRSRQRLLQCMRKEQG
jgi:glutamyl-tRNA synthetase